MNSEKKMNKEILLRIVEDIEEYINENYHNYIDCSEVESQATYVPYGNTMVELPELVELSEDHKLKVASILWEEGLVQYNKNKGVYEIINGTDSIR